MRNRCFVFEQQKLLIIGLIYKNGETLCTDSPQSVLIQIRDVCCIQKIIKNTNLLVFSPKALRPNCLLIFGRSVAINPLWLTRNPHSISKYISTDIQTPFYISCSVYDVLVWGFVSEFLKGFLFQNRNCEAVHFFEYLKGYEV